MGAVVARAARGAAALDTPPLAPQLDEYGATGWTSLCVRGALRQECVNRSMAIDSF